MAGNPLQAMHEQAEASFLPYGPDLVIVESFGEVEAEYAALRKGAALMDDPHRAVVVLTGKDRLGFLQSLLTNDTKKLQPGQGCYAYLLNTKGRIVMDLNVLQTEDATLLEVDSRLAATLVKELEKYLFADDVKVMDASEQLGRMTLMGPGAGRLLKQVTDAGVETLDEAFRNGKRTIRKTVVTVFRNDLCGEAQFELIVPRDQMVELWQVLHESGNGHGEGGEGEAGEGGIGLKAIGWSAFNVARVEAGTPWYGIDISEQYLPMETGRWYERAVAVSKGCYLGQEIVARMHAHNSVARMLVGVRVEGEALPMAGTDVSAGGNALGIVTSSCMSPMLGFVGVVLGYVKPAHAEVGKEVELMAEGKRVKGKVVALPFWKKAAAAG